MHNQTLHINSDIENYNVQDRKLTDSCPKDKYKFKLQITNNTNSKKKKKKKLLTHLFVLLLDFAN